MNRYIVTVVKIMDVELRHSPNHMDPWHGWSLKVNGDRGTRLTAEQLREFISEAEAALAAVEADEREAERGHSGERSGQPGSVGGQP